METLSSVHNAMVVLKSFAHENQAMGVSEISSKLGMSKSTVFRILQTLSDEGLLEKRENKYRLGLAAFEIGFAYYYHLDLLQTAHPFLEKLSKNTRKIVHLGVYDKGEVMYIYKNFSDEPNVEATKIGRRTPCYCTSSGKVLLASQSEEEINRVLKQPLKKYTDKTISDTDLLKKMLEDVRTKKYARNINEYRNGVVSLAVPVMDQNLKVIAAISLIGVNEHFYSADINNFLREMNSCSKLITEYL